MGTTIFRRSLCRSGQRAFDRVRLVCLCLAALGLALPAGAQITLEHTAKIGGSCKAVHVFGNHAYIAEGRDLKIVDISNPTSPTLRGHRILNGAVNDVFVTSNTAYVVDAFGGFTIYDVSNPSLPIYRSFSWTMSTRVFVWGHYAYVNDFSSGGMMILDVSVPTAPRICYSPGGGGGTHLPWSVYVTGGVAYLCSEGELVILDVTKPASPRLLGYWFRTDSLVEDVYVSGSMAYVTSGADLKILDVSNPSTPTLRGSFTTPGHARRVHVSGGLAYVADDSGGLQIIDVSDPTSPTLRGTYRTPGNAVDVYVRWGRVYVAAEDSGLQIIDAFNPAAPKFRGDYQTVHNPRGTVTSGSLAYVADGERGLTILDVPYPWEARPRGRYALPGYTNDVVLSGDLAYVAGSQGLQIVNVSDTSSPTRTASYDIGANAVDVQTTSGLVYVLDSAGVLRILGATDPSSPVLRGAFDSQVRYGQFFIAGGRAYITGGVYGLGGREGFCIVDVSDPTSPTLRGFRSGHFRDVRVSGKWAYVTEQRSDSQYWLITRLQLIDVSNPSSPTLGGYWETPGAPGGLAVEGNLAYFTVGSAVFVVEGFGPERARLRGTYYYSYANENILPNQVWASNRNVYVSAGRDGLYALHYTPALPLRPSPIGAQVVGLDRIRVSWGDNSTFEDSFHVERKIGAGGRWAEAVVIQSYSHWTGGMYWEQAGLTQGVIYYYRVRAYNTIGFSPYSNETSAVIPLRTPVAPSRLRARFEPPQMIRLDWQDNSSDEDQFWIERKTGATGGWSEIGNRGPYSTSFQDGGVSANTTYFYRVRAHNFRGYSTYSNVTSATTVFNPPRAPTNLVARPISWSQVVLSWRDNSTSETGFDVERQIGSAGGWVQVAILDANVRTFRDMGVSPGLVYSYRVRSFNGSGSSTYSNVAWAKTPPNATVARPAWALYR
jgi:hypothetical protein